MQKVIVYSTSTCHYCHAAKDFLDKNSIKYENKNVSEDEEALKEMMDKSHQMGVPVLDIDGEIIIGFDEKKMRELLKISASGGK